MIITVSGLPRSGTSSVCNQLLARLDGAVAYVNGGDIFRARAQVEGMDLNEFSKHVNENPEIDREIDGTLRAIVKAYTERDNRITVADVPVEPRPSEVDHLLVESRLAGWISGQFADVKVWLEADSEIRRKRAGENHEQQQQVTDREWDERARYDRWYDIDIDDTSIYDITIDTALWNSETIAETLKEYIESYDPEPAAVRGARSEYYKFDDLIPDRFYVNS